MPGDLFEAAGGTETVAAPVGAVRENPHVSLSELLSPGRDISAELSNRIGQHCAAPKVLLHLDHGEPGLYVDAPTVTNLSLQLHAQIVG